MSLQVLLLSLLLFVATVFAGIVFHVPWTVIVGVAIFALGTVVTVKLRRKRDPV